MSVTFLALIHLIDVYMTQHSTQLSQDRFSDSLLDGSGAKRWTLLWIYNDLEALRASSHWWLTYLVNIASQPASQPGHSCVFVAVCMCVTIWTSSWHFAINRHDQILYDEDRNGSTVVYYVAKPLWVLCIHFTTFLYQMSVIFWGTCAK